MLVDADIHYQCHWKLEDVVGSRVVGPERPRDWGFDVPHGTRVTDYCFVWGKPQQAQCTVEHHNFFNFLLIINTAQLIFFIFFEH